MPLLLNRVSFVISLRGIRFFVPQKPLPWITPSPTVMAARRNHCEIRNANKVENNGARISTYPTIEANGTARFVECPEMVTRPMGTRTPPIVAIDIKIATDLKTYRQPTGNVTSMRVVQGLTTPKISD